MLLSYLTVGHHVIYTHLLYTTTCDMTQPYITMSFLVASRLNSLVSKQKYFSKFIIVKSDGLSLYRSTSSSQHVSCILSPHYFGLSIRLMNTDTNDKPKSIIETYRPQLNQVMVVAGGALTLYGIGRSISRNGL